MIILSRHGGGESQAALEGEVVERFRQAGQRVVVIPHLYHLAEESGVWKRLREEAGGAVVLLSWLYPRPAEWVLRRHGIGGEGVRALDLRSFGTAEACYAAVKEAAGAGEVCSIDEATGQRWYPVVDGSRCVNCQHCFQFCLFGVYAVDEGGRVRVENPDQCKPGCPACSRICPEGAILFPLYEKDEVIAGIPGRFMTPDLAARRMFYSRTHRPCARCGGVVQGPAAVGGEGEVCPECGSKVTPKTAQEPAAFDDLDKLIDQLDQVTRRKR